MFALYLLLQNIYVYSLFKTSQKINENLESPKENRFYLQATS